MQMIRLRRGDQHLVDPACQEGGEPAVGSRAEAGEHVGKRLLEIEQRFRTVVDRLKRIDQHDLAVEPCEVFAKERAHHMLLVGLVAPLHHRPERTFRCAAIREIGKRREGECR
ncbi:hypothetical protein D9M70_592300 [compost metagenome]